MAAQRHHPRLGVGLAALAAFVVAATVSANNFGSNVGTGGTPAHACDASMSSQCINNNSADLIIWGSPLAQSHKDAILFAIDDYNAHNPDIFMYISALGPDLVDVIVSDTTMTGNGQWSWGQCRSPATYGGADPNRWCYPVLLKWNLAYEKSKYPGTTAKNDIACHELGHTMGLRHSNELTGSCMIYASTTYVTTTTHDRAMLQGHY